MSFGRGGGRGGFRGGFRGGRGGGRPFIPQGPPSEVSLLGEFQHSSENDMVCRCLVPKIPKFNQTIYLENKQEIGKLDDVFGPINEVYFTVKPAEGVVASSFAHGDKVYIAPDGLLPLTYFTNPQQPPHRGGGAGRRGGRGFGGRAGRGGMPGRGRSSFGGRGGSGFRGRGRSFSPRRGGGAGFSRRRGGGP